MQEQQTDPKPLAAIAPQVQANATSRRKPLSEAELADREQQRETERRGDLLKAVIKAAGGERYRGYKLDAWQARTPYQREVLDTVTEWVNSYPDRLATSEGLILYGPVGTGKDHLMMGAIGRVIGTHGPRSVEWKNGRNLAGDLRDLIGSNRSEAAFLSELIHPEILVLSDPLPPNGDLKEHQADMLYRIIEGRYAAGRITCATINVADDAEADRRMGAATWDRLCDGAWKIPCFWPSARKPAKEMRPPANR